MGFLPDDLETFLVPGSLPAAAALSFALSFLDLGPVGIGVSLLEDGPGVVSASVVFPGVVEELDFAAGAPFLPLPFAAADNAPPAALAAAFAAFFSLALAAIFAAFSLRRNSNNGVFLALAWSIWT